MLRNLATPCLGSPEEKARVVDVGVDHAAVIGASENNLGAPTEHEETGPSNSSENKGQDSNSENMLAAAHLLLHKATQGTAAAAAAVPGAAAGKKKKELPPPTAFRGQDFCKLRQELATSGKLFEDPEFPAADSSLYFSHPFSYPIKWIFFLQSVFFSSVYFFFLRSISFLHLISFHH